MSNPSLLIVAGPNGVGKSTFIEQLITLNKDISQNYICPDIIANQIRRLNPHKNEYEIYIDAMAQAKRLRYEKLMKKEDIILETVFSSHEKIKFIKHAMDKKYSITMMFIGVENIAINIERITKRMALGGHGVPFDKIEPRFLKSIENLIFAYKEGLFHKLFLVDNSSEIEPYRFYLYFKNKNLSWLNKDISINTFNIINGSSNIPSWIVTIGQALIKLSNNINPEHKTLPSIEELFIKDIHLD